LFAKLAFVGRMKMRLERGISNRIFIISKFYFSKQDRGWLLLSKKIAFYFLNFFGECLNRLRIFLNKTFFW